MDSTATQRIIKIRRDYNTWVANETLEDYALRFTPVSFRKWSEFRMANTALGAVSFLALEAIGGTLVMNYGFLNSFWAIIAVSILVFLTSLPIAYYAATYGLDMDLLTRGAGFGYIGSTITSLIYASFTFIFFAIEASIMALAVELATGLPLWVSYFVCAVVIIPFVTYGITLINRLQSWTQSVWLVLLVLPYACVIYQDPGALMRLADFGGVAGHHSFNLLMFGAGATVAASLITQIGEQVDFLRFLPERKPANRRRWWIALLCAGPGWVIPGAIKMLAGAFLAYLALQHGVPSGKSVDPTHMYHVAFGYVFSNPTLVLAVTAVFVIVSQVKINVTNAYAGSLAWSNFFARITHSHPGRVVWLIFNVLIAVGLMEMGVFDALEHVLAIFSHVALAWIGALVGDLVINKSLGLSPRDIEFRRAYLYDINPVGVGAMLISLVLSLLIETGLFGETARALSPFISLLSAFLAAPAIAAATQGRYYRARQPVPLQDQAGGSALTCVICANPFEASDMAHCPAYNGVICSLCCTLDVRCHDRCKPQARLREQIGNALRRLLPESNSLLIHTRLAYYVAVLGVIAAVLAAILALIYYQEATQFLLAGIGSVTLRSAFFKLFAALFLIGGCIAWWMVLTNESRHVAQEESDRQTALLLHEIKAHRDTDEKLQQAKEVAEAANLAKSRFMGGLSHELRAPLNSLLGYAQILQRDASLSADQHDAVDVIHRSGKHLVGLIDGMLDIARIEAGKLKLETVELRLPEFLDQIVKMFQPQAMLQGLRFDYEVTEDLPRIVLIDEKRLRQILINLMSNAVKFTRIGHVALRVLYATDIMTIEVQDSGAGIPAEDLDRIFTPFERSWAAAEYPETGTGLGLTTCRMLTNVMGGELTVKSAVGRGSVFTLKLFLTTVRSPRDNPLPAGAIMGYAGPRRGILVVDDQTTQRRILRDTLIPLGFDVHEATDGQSCLAKAGALRPDLILMDISMPGMPGNEAARALREQGNDTPIIIVSANAYSLSPDETSTMTDWLIKPVIIDELLEKIGLHLGLQWILQPAAAQEPPDFGGITLAREDTESLLELGAMGYVKGILIRLDDILSRAPHAGPLLSHLAMLVREFRFSQYSKILKEHVRRESTPD